MKKNIVLILLLASVHIVYAQCTTIPITSETSFASEGKLDFVFAGGGTGTKILAQPDGKYLVAGYVDSLSSTNEDVFIVRFNENGTPDATFGNNGRVVYDYGNHNNRIYDMALTSDNKIVLAGSTQGLADKNVLVMKLNSNGTPDQTFGTYPYPGFVEIDAGFSFNEEITSVALDASDGIIMGGSITIGSYKNLFILKLNTTGTLNTGFGSSGIWSTNLSPSGDDLVNDVQFDQMNGILYLAGTYYNSSTTSYDSYVLAINSTATAYITSFSDDGQFYGDLSSGGLHDGINALHLMPDGKMLFTGYTTSANNTEAREILIGRFDAYGSLDASFGTGGLAPLLGYSNNDEGKCITLQPDGKILAGGYHSSMSAGFIVRLTAGGAFDTSFDSDADGTYSSSDFSLFNSLLISSNGRLLGTGISISSGLSIKSHRIRCMPSITYSGPDLTYGDEEIVNAALSNSTGAFSYSVKTGSTFIDIDETTGELTTKGSGTAQIKVYQELTASYYGDSAFATVNISKAELIVTPQNATKIYGDPEPSITLAYTGFKFSDNVSMINILPTGSASSSEATSTGDYTIVVSGGSDDNYTFDINATATLTVSKAELIITPQNTTKVYGEAEPTIPLSYSGFKLSDNEGVLNTAPTATASTSETTSAGDYTIAVSGGSDDNYIFNTSATALLSISKKQLVITAENISRAQGELNPTLPYSIDGFVNNEDETDLNGHIVLTTSADVNSIPNDYPITIDLNNISSQNYSFTKVDGILTVTISTGILSPENTYTLLFHPNPAINGHFNIKGLQDVTEVQIFNVLGQREVFYSEEINTSLSGVLTVLVKSNGKIYSGKVVIP